MQGLPSLFKEHGLELIDIHNIPTKESHRYFWSHSQLLGLEEITDSPQAVGIGKTPEGLQSLIEGLSTEFANGVSHNIPWLCVVGKKPI